MSEKSKFFESIKNFANFWNLLKVLVVLVCFGWFCFNAIQIGKKFFEYQTISKVEYRHPDPDSGLPAFTICGYSFISNEVLQNQYSDDWNVLMKDSSKNDKYAVRQTLRENVLLESTAQQIFNETGFQLQDIIDECRYYPKYQVDPEQYIPCHKISSTIQSVFNGKKCFTLFSQLNTSQNNYPVQQMEYEMKPFVEIILTNQSDTYFTDNFENETFIFTIHSPNIIPTFLDNIYYRMYLQKNINYEFRFTKQIQYLKPPPYKTMCRSYSAKDPFGQRSRGDCLNHCIKEKTFDKCFNYYSIITLDQIETGNEIICTESDSSADQFAIARAQCLDTCHMSCIEEVIEIPYSECFESEIDSTIIVIKSDESLYTYVYHREVMDEPNFFANIGGNAHIWLGLSAIKIFHWITHFVHYVKRTFLK